MASFTGEGKARKCAILALSLQNEGKCVMWVGWAHTASYTGIKFTKQELVSELVS